MSSHSWFHTKPNVPQPPYNLSQQQAGPSQRKRDKAPASALPYMAPDVPPLRDDDGYLPPKRSTSNTQSRPAPQAPAPQTHANPHQQRYHGQQTSAPPSQGLPAAPKSLRHMTPDERAAQYAASQPARAVTTTTTTTTQKRLSGVKPLALADKADYRHRNSLPEQTTNTQIGPDSPHLSDESMGHYFGQLQQEMGEAPDPPATSAAPAQPSVSAPVNEYGRASVIMPSDEEDHAPAAVLESYGQAVTTSAEEDRAKTPTPAPTQPESPAPVVAPPRSSSLPVQLSALDQGDVCVEVMGQQQTVVARLLLKGLLARN